MALQVRTGAGGKISKLIALPMLMLALVVQPMYGLVAGQVASAAEGIQAISVSNMYFGKKYGFLNYIGTSFTTSGFASTEVSSVKVDLLSGNRVVISNVGKAEDVNNLISNTASRTISVPFYIPTANTLTGSWTTTSYTWKKADRPTGVKVTIETVGGAVITGENKNDVLSNSDFESKLIQAPAAAPVIAGLEQGRLLSGSDLPLSVSWSRPSRTSLFEYRITKDGSEYVSERIAEQGMVLSGLESGEYSLEVRGLSVSHMEGPWSEPVNFTVDITGPSATIESVTLDGKSVQSANGAEITLKASDKNGLNRYDLTLWEDGTRTPGAKPLFSKGGVINLDSNEEFTSSFKLPANLNLGDGSYTVYYTVKDRAGISADATSMKFTIDKTAPTSESLTIEKIVDGNIGGDAFRVSVELRDPSGVNLDKKYTWIRFHIDGKEYSYGFTKVDGTENVYEAIIDTRDFVKKNTFAIANVTVRFADNLLNGRSSKPKVLQGVGIDNAGPVARVGAGTLVDGQPVSGDVTIDLDITEHTRVEGGWAALVGAGGSDKDNRVDIVKNVETGTWTATFNTLAMADGDYSLQIRPVDVFGNAAYNANRLVLTVDNTLDIPSMSHDMKVTEGDVMGVSFDLAPDVTPALEIAGRPVSMTRNGSTWGVSFSTVGLSVGTYPISLTLNDLAGNIKEVTSEFSIVAALLLDAPEPLIPDRSEAPEVPGAPTLGGGGSIFAANANVFTLPGETAGQSDNTEVLGTQADRSAGDSDETFAAVPTAEGWKIFGLMWYWWLAIVAAIAAVWWLIAAARRRNRDEVSA